MNYAFLINLRTKLGHTNGILFNLQWSEQRGSQYDSRHCGRQGDRRITGSRPSSPTRCPPKSRRERLANHPTMVLKGWSHFQFRLNLHTSHSTTHVRFRSCRIFLVDYIPFFQLRVFHCPEFRLMLGCYMLRLHFLYCICTSQHCPSRNSGHWRMMFRPPCHAR